MNNSWRLAAVSGERSAFFPTPSAPGAASDSQTRLEPETALSCPSVDVGAYLCPVRTYPHIPVPLHLRLSSPCASTLRPRDVYTSVLSLRRPGANHGRPTGPFPSANLWFGACDSLGLNPSPTPTSVHRARQQRQEGPCPNLILTPPTSWPHPHTGPTHIHTYLAVGKLRPQVPQDTPRSDGSPRLVLAPDQLFSSPRSTAFLIDQGPYLIKNLIQTSLSCPG